MSSIDQTELCCRIVDEAPDAILYSDREGIIRLWNRLFGMGYARNLGIVRCDRPLKISP
ncbi:hypothetical protein [Geoalkalibacter subterraneus]|uniref:hypothetical protein n=1 Tax=Geoalkalibacter subterraneus TaxID=483547 RepID=UPI00130D847F|nr:hypothetical protein [Geoalkalibacter subterraneus]